MVNKMPTFPTSKLKRYTHAVPDSRSAYTLLFRLEECDRCGADCKATDSLKVLIGRQVLHSFGIELVEDEPSDLHFDPDFGGAVCDKCSC